MNATKDTDPEAATVIKLSGEPMALDETDRIDEEGQEDDSEDSDDDGGNGTVLGKGKKVGSSKTKQVATKADTEDLEKQAIDVRWVLSPQRHVAISRLTSQAASYSRTTVQAHLS
jgi:hypothetical protein